MQTNYPSPLKGILWRSCFLSLALLFVCVRFASAQTVREQLKQDQNFRLYSVIFGITVGTNSTLESVRVAKVIDPKSGSTDAVKVDVPQEYIKAARRKMEAKHYDPKLEDGKPVEFFTYFFYTPTHPAVVITDLDKPLDKQP